MVGSVDLNGWARSLGVTNDDDAVVVVEDLRARVTEMEATAAHLQTKVAGCPGDVGVAFGQVLRLLEVASDELIEVRAGFGRHERGDR